MAVIGQMQIHDSTFTNAQCNRSVTTPRNYSLFLSLCHSVCPFVSLSVCLSVCLVVVLNVIINQCISCSMLAPRVCLVCVCVSTCVYRSYRIRLLAQLFKSVTLAIPLA